MHECGHPEPLHLNLAPFKAGEVGEAVTRGTKGLTVVDLDLTKESINQSIKNNLAYREGHEKEIAGIPTGILLHATHLPIIYKFLYTLSLSSPLPSLPPSTTLLLLPPSSYPSSQNVVTLPTPHPLSFPPFPPSFPHAFFQAKIPWAPSSSCGLISSYGKACTCTQSITIVPPAPMASSSNCAICEEDPRTPTMPL